MYGEPDEAESIATLHRAIEIGMDFLDTSDMYGNGHNEELVGRAIAGRRGRVILATKFGNIRNPDGTADVNGRPEYVATACEASLSVSVSTMWISTTSTASTRTYPSRRPWAPWRSW